MEDERPDDYRRTAQNSKPSYIPKSKLYRAMTPFRCFRCDKYVDQPTGHPGFCSWTCWQENQNEAMAK